MSSVVRIEHLQYKYGDRVALNDVSFSVESKEIFGILGPNGGGKSTTFRLLSTFLEAPKGAIEIFGHDPASHSAEIRKKIGVVFQSGSLDRKLKVKENMIHQGHLYGMSGASLKQRSDQLLSRFGISDRAQDLVETLSGGMRRRVEVAKGMLHHPELLILDEPSSGLDPAARAELWKYLEELRSNDGVTVLLTTHFLEEAERCDRLAILDQGKVVAIGTPAELTKEIGEEVIDIRTRRPEELKERLQKESKIAGLILNGNLRIEGAGMREQVPQMLNTFGEMIDSITIGRPTLEDVFLRRTGKRLNVSE